MRRMRNIFIVFLLFLFSLIISPLFTRAENTPDKDHSDLSVSSSVPADGQTTAIVTVTLRDGSNNPINGHTVTLSDSSNSGVTITTILGTTDVNGHALFSIKSSKPQTDNLDVTDTTANVKFYTLGKITFTIAGCSDSPPGGTPQLLSAVAKGSNQIVLNLAGVANPVSHYLISYGLASGQYIYGNPNVGGQGTTSYAIGSLSPGKKYYFVVQAINGCTPGNFSNEVSATAGRIFPTVTNIPFPTTSQENITISGIETPTPSPYIQSASVVTPTRIPLLDDQKSNMMPIISIGIVVLGSAGNYLYWKYKKNQFS